jgi:hypothetical protein
VATTALGLAAGWLLTDWAVSISWPLGIASSLIIAIFIQKKAAAFRHTAAHRREFPGHDHVL